jgi:hypothetical protein
MPFALAPMLDPDWDDRGWELDLAERLQRGGALHSLAVNDLIRSHRPGRAAEGWEAAEEHSKDAIRSGSVFLNDEAIARRLPERERRKKAYAEEMARWEENRVWQAEWDDAEWRRADAEREERQRGVVEIVLEQLREKDQAHYDKLQADAKRRLEERATILSKQWQCKKCLSIAEISLHLGQYQLICRACRDRALGDHATLVRMMAA